MSTDRRREIAGEAARIVCAEQLTDYHVAKTRAVHRLGYPPRTALPDNGLIQSAVVDYQRLFGGTEYREVLRRMRATAVSAMRLFAPFSPRLVGATLSGAVTAAHRVQLHAFSDYAEALDIHLLDRGIDFEPGERKYRYPDGHERTASLLQLELGGQGVDVAVFTEHELHRAPINPLDGKPFRRLDLAEAEHLASAP